jgi:hypothetical protein
LLPTRAVFWRRGDVFAYLSGRARLADFLPRQRSAAPEQERDEYETVRRSMRIPWDIAVGRWLALCAHPVCTWRVRSSSARALVVTSYFAAAYVGVLTVLFSLSA